MVILFALLIVWTPIVVAKVFWDRQARAGRAGHPRKAPMDPPSRQQTDAIASGTPLWSALDDRQLTRLLINSAPRSNTE